MAGGLAVRRIVLATVLAAAGGTAQAAEVDITCKIARAEDLVNGALVRAPVDGPWNFTITPDGLKTPWGGSCAVMTGEVNSDRVSVSCEKTLSETTTVKRTVAIDRHLGTYKEYFEVPRGIGPASIRYSDGVCEKREGF